jgi:two-component system, OmpR family, response regulator
MAAPRVLVVEDDADVRRLVRRGLEEEGFEVRAADSGSTALEAAGGEAPDLLVIDIGLPDADGRDLCQALRSRGMSAPVIFLTAKDAVSDRLSGFEVGGDDYLTKPFAFAELVARVRALLKRGGPEAATVAGDLRLDPIEHAVARGGESSPLTPIEFRLLGTLSSRFGETVRRRELVRAAWPDGAIVHDNTLDVYIARLRRKLGGLGARTEIGTVVGVGYVLR